MSEVCQARSPPNVATVGSKEREANRSPIVPANAAEAAAGMNGRCLRVFFVRLRVYVYACVCENECARFMVRMFTEYTHVHVCVCIDVRAHEYTHACTCCCTRIMRTLVHFQDLVNFAVRRKRQDEVMHPSWVQSLYIYTCIYVCVHVMCVYMYTHTHTCIYDLPVPQYVG